MAMQKISNRLKQIHKNAAVVIVAGKQAAIIYELRDGKIFEDRSIKVENPKYSDHEGLNMRRGKGTVYGTASANQHKDTGVVIDFLHQLRKFLKELAASKEFEAVYLFAPDQNLALIKASLPTSWAEKISYEYRGNFTKLPPAELLQRITAAIQRQKARKTIELKKEAGKILTRKRVKKSGR